MSPISSVNEETDMTITYKVAMAAGADAANKNMRANGRTTWNEDDWNVMAAVIARLLSPTT